MVYIHQDDRCRQSQTLENLVNDQNRMCMGSRVCILYPQRGPQLTYKLAVRMYLNYRKLSP